MTVKEEEQLKRAIAIELSVEDSGVSMEQLLCQQKNNLKLSRELSTESPEDISSPTIQKKT